MLYASRSASDALARHFSEQREHTRIIYRVGAGDAPDVHLVAVAVLYALVGVFVHPLQRRVDTHSHNKDRVRIFLQYAEYLALCKINRPGLGPLCV